jgi:alginate O-acetyltransferase complex protein AlgJ
VTVFFLMLVIPLFGTMLRIDGGSATMEKRTLAQRPTWHFGWNEINKFPAQFEAFYNDHFGFRGTLIGWRSRIKVSLLAESPTPLVVIGKAGWLFYAGDSEEQESIKDYEGLMPLSPQVLQSMYATLVERRDNLARQGIKYLFVVVPNKHTVYGEYLRSVRPDRAETRLDQFDAFVNQHGFRDYLDLRETLTNAKPLGVLYYKIDSHWNMLGGWIGQRRLLERVSDTLSVPDLKALSAYETSYLKKTSGDLTLLMGLDRGFVDEDILLQLSQPQNQPSKTPYVSGRSNGFVTELADDRLPTVVVFGDSFLDAYLAYFLADHFRRAVFIRSLEWNQDLIDLEKPDLVITEIAERNLAAALAR